MSVTLSDRNAAGAVYTSAAAAFIAAYVDLAAKERACDRLGIALDAGGRFGSETGAVDLIPLRHPRFAPHIDLPRLEDQIQTALAAL
jgi:hypothetical protein